MRWRYVFSTVGIFVGVFGLTMAAPLLVGWGYRDGSVPATAKAMVITLIAGMLLFFIKGKETVEYISQREGMAVVTLGWTAMGLFGALPFYLGGEIPVFTDAVFESISGFTTTGASILNNIEGLSKGLLFWRSLIQWLGGMGIIVLSLAVLPFLGVGGMQLYKAEVPSPVPDKLTPRIRDTALALWKVYILFTLAEMILLLLGGMNLYDAASHALTTLPTGGFSTKNASITHFNSGYIEGVIWIFMLFAGINFSLHYQMLRGKPLAFWRDPEGRFFLGVVFFLTIIIVINIYGKIYQELGDAVRYGAFQVLSIVTTTGYATADYELWPAASQLILFFCMFLGASAGSTGGGVKCLRVMLLIKFCYRELFSFIHPRSVSSIKIGKTPVSNDVMRSVLGFLALFVGLFAVSSILLAEMGVDFLTAIGAVASSLGNIGPGFGLVGPVENYAGIPISGKWLLAWCMLLGRLEVYTVIIFLVPEFYRK